jgi:hypothetical protein
LRQLKEPPRPMQHTLNSTWRSLLKKDRANIID